MSKVKWVLFFFFLLETVMKHSLLAYIVYIVAFAENFLTRLTFLWKLVAFVWLPFCESERVLIPLWTGNIFGPFWGLKSKSIRMIVISSWWKKVWWTSGNIFLWLVYFEYILFLVYIWLNGSKKYWKIKTRWFIDPISTR